MRIRTAGVPGTARAIAVGALALLVAAAGCGGGGKGSGTTDEEVPRVDINPVSREKLPSGGTMRWPMSEFPTQLNLAHLNGGRVAVAEIMGALLPSPFRYDEKANPKVNPLVMRKATLTSKTPKQVVTYELNPKAKWSDGKPITWKELESQWKALNGKDQRFQIASSNGYNRIESVKRGKSDHEAVVTYAKPYGDWQSVFDPIYPASTTSDPNTFNNGWVGKVPVTAGPFEFDSIDKTAKTVTVVRDPKYWGPKAKLDKIVFRSLDEATAEINGFKNGELDFMTVGTNASAYKQAQQTKGAKIRRAAAPDYAVITYNGTSPNLKDLNVRKAVAMTINRDTIAKSALQAVEWPAVPMNNHFFVNTQSGYQNNASTQAKADPKAAGKLLDKAGWKLSGKKRMKGGKQLTLKFVIPSGTPRSKQVGLLAQGMLAKVGIKLDIDEVPLDDFFDDYITPGNYDLAPSAWQGTPFPVSSSRSIYVMPTKDSKGDLQIQQNFARIGSAKIDAAMDAAIAELDPAKAVDKANRADKLIWDEVHSTPMYQQPQLRACKEKLANFGANGFQSVVYENIGFTK